MSNEALLVELYAALAEVNQALVAMKERYEAEKKRVLSKVDDPYYPSFYAMVTMDGKPLASDLLVAKTNLILAIANCKRSRY